MIAVIIAAVLLIAAVGGYLLTQRGVAARPDTSITVNAVPWATVKSVTTLASNFDVMPWAVMKTTYQLGQAYPIYTDNSSSNNGAVSLPYENGPNCPTPNGANPYEEEITGQLQPCGITVGQQIDVKSGNNTGPTAQGLNVRITNWMPFNQIVTNISGFAEWLPEQRIAELHWIDEIRRVFESLAAAGLGRASGRGQSADSIARPGGGQRRPGAHARETIYARARGGGCHKGGERGDEKYKQPEAERHEPSHKVPESHYAPNERWGHRESGHRDCHQALKPS